jgi:hypothetical protein
MFGDIDSLIVGAMVEIADEDLALLWFDVGLNFSSLEGHFVIVGIIIIRFFHIR